MKSSEIVLPDGLGRENYWYVRVTGTTPEYIVKTQLIPLVKDIPEKERPVLIVQTKDDLIYLLSKKYIGIELLMKVTGYSEDVLTKADLIELREKKYDGLPEATVDYWGTA